jgi:hypothetical protein
LRERHRFLLKNLNFSRWHTPCNEQFRRGTHVVFTANETKSKSTGKEHSMKKILTILAVTAALCVGADSLRAQDNGGGGGRGTFDPAQFQQRRLERIKEDLGFTNDTEWSAVEPLVQKVMDAQMANRFAGFRGGRRGGNADNGGGNPNRPQPPSNPDREALQQAVDSNVPPSQLAAALEKYRASQKTKQSRLEQAQSDLAKVLTPKQEAQAVLAGLLN